MMGRSAAAASAGPHVSAMFDLRRERDAPILLSVSHNGDTPHVGRYDAAHDQTSQSLTPLNLYKSAAAIPTTRVVQTLR